MDTYKLRRRLQLILSLPWSIFFNLYYLPLSQAVHLPIILYYPKLITMKGRITIKDSKIYFGMIRLGLFISPLGNSTGFLYQNEGGNIVIKGNVCLGAGSVLLVHKGATLEFGNNFSNAVSLKIDCSYKIFFGKNVMFGWNCMVMDSHQHRIKNENGNFTSKGYDEIIINDDIWVSTNCVILGGAKLPQKSILALGSILNKDYSHSENGMFAGSPAKLKKIGLWKDAYDNKIQIF